MNIERIVSSSERGFVERSVDYIESCMNTHLVRLLMMIVFFPFLLWAFADTRTGEIALWYTLDSCLSKTTPTFVYTLRAAAAAGARGGVPTPGLALALTLVLALALALALTLAR